MHQAGAARHAFFDALLADQRAALQPDFKAPFSSANDVVRRLLPYHVWHVNEGDLYHLLQQGVQMPSSPLLNGEAAAAAAETAGESSSLPSTSASTTSLAPYKSRRNAKKRRREILDVIPDAFPSGREADHFFAKYASIHGRLKKLRSQLVGAIDTSGLGGTAPFGRESSNLLDRLAMETEREELIADQDAFRKEKERAAAAGVSWEDLIRITSSMRAYGTVTAPGDGSDEDGSDDGDDDDDEDEDDEEESDAESGSGSESESSSAPDSEVAPPPAAATNRSYAAQSPSTPAGAGRGAGRGRGRPRKTGDRNAPSAQGSPAAYSPYAARPPNMGTPYGSPMGLPMNPPMGMPMGGAPPMPMTPSMIPQHPIPLVLPLATLPRLSELGITIVPAPHLVPAIRARQAAQAQGIGAAADTAFARYNTAPRPGPPDQQEAALLLGITMGRTQAPGRSSASGGSGAATGTEMLHVNVRLTRLDAFQLSGLAALMQSLQHMPAGTLPVPTDPRGNTAVGAVVAAYVAGGMNVPNSNPQRPSAGPSTHLMGSNASPIRSEPMQQQQQQHRPLQAQQQSQGQNQGQASGQGVLAPGPRARPPQAPSVAQPSMASSSAGTTLALSSGQQNTAQPDASSQAPHQQVGQAANATPQPSQPHDHQARNAMEGLNVPSAPESSRPPPPPPQLSPQAPHQPDQQSPPPPPPQPLTSQPQP